MSNSIKMMAGIGALVGVLLFGASLYFLRQAYTSLTIAFLLAYLLEPLVGRLERRGLSRQWGGPIALGVFFVAIGLLALAIVPSLISQGVDLWARWPQLMSVVSIKLAPLSERILGYNALENFDRLVQSMGERSALVQPLGGLVRDVFSQTFRMVTAVLGLLVIPLMAFYMIRSYPTFYSALLYLIPTRYHGYADEIRGRLDGVLGGFLRGQLVVSSILSIYYTIWFVALGIDLPLALGMLAGFLNVIPYVGILSVLVLTLLVSVIHGAGPAVLAGIVVAFALGMALEGSLLTPRIVGRRVGLEPLTLIFALLVGSELLGLVGMLIAIPIAAVVKVFLGFALAHYRGSALYKA